jgi:serine/threonine protein kinase|tara:strand:- start:2894 stop:3421 length:528 start_codon:yes stop_codon:yes gene_type:complete
MPSAKIDLFEWVQQPFSWETAAGYLTDVARGILWLHRHGIGHGDIKPENVVIGTENAMLIDFDFSVPFKEWHYCGTPYYIAPGNLIKKWKGPNCDISRRMDVYAYGKTILTVLYFYMEHSSEKTSDWFRKPYIAKNCQHGYTGQQQVWGDLAFECCRQVPCLEILEHIDKQRGRK